MPFWELGDGVREQYAIERQREKIGRLQDENAKLQGDLKFKRMQIEVFCGAVRWLMESNTKLRELAIGLEWCTGHACWNGDDYESCPLYRPDAVGDERYGCEALKSELGIEA